MFLLPLFNIHLILTLSIKIFFYFNCSKYISYSLLKLSYVFTSIVQYTFHYQSQYKDMLLLQMCKIYFMLTLSIKICCYFNCSKYISYSLLELRYVVTSIVQNTLHTHSQYKDMLLRQLFKIHFILTLSIEICCYFNCSKYTSYSLLLL